MGHEQSSASLLKLFAVGHDKIRSGADLRGASPLVSFNHVIDPHFVAFFSSLQARSQNFSLGIGL